MVPTDSLTKIEMVANTNGAAVEKGSAPLNLELKLLQQDNNSSSSDTATNTNTTVNVNNNTRMVLEGLGLVADSDKAQVKSQLFNLRSQLDSLLSSLSQ